MAYIDNAKRFIAMPKQSTTCKEFFTTVQGNCDLLADLSLVIQMGRNVKKCTLYLYNIPQHTNIPVFTSTAWSIDAQGPTTGNIATVIMYRDGDENLICSDISKTIRNEVQQNIRDIITDRKYLGVLTNS
jgi:hypothetical protein